MKNVNFLFVDLGHLSGSRVFFFDAEKNEIWTCMYITHDELFLFLCPHLSLALYDDSLSHFVDASLVVGLSLYKAKRVSLFVVTINRQGIQECEFSMNFVRICIQHWVFEQKKRKFSSFWSNNSIKSWNHSISMACIPKTTCK